MFCTEQFMQAVYADCIIEVQGCVDVPVHAVNVRIGRLCQWHVRANVNPLLHSDANRQQVENVQFSQIN